MCIGKTKLKVSKCSRLAIKRILGSSINSKQNVKSIGSSEPNLVYFFDVFKKFLSKLKSTDVSKYCLEKLRFLGSIL